MVSAQDSTADQVRRGRRLAAAAATALVTMSALAIVTYAIGVGTHRLPQQAIRFVLTLGLGYALVRGYPWARGLAIVLCVLAIIPTILTARLARVTPGAVLPMVALSAIYLGIGAVLLLSPSVAAFFRVREETSASSRGAGARGS